MTVVLAHAPVDSADTHAVGEAVLQELARRVRQEGVQARSVHLADSDAAALLNLGENVNADPLVIDVRQRSAIGKLLMGSTAQRLIPEAQCPVLAAKS